MRTEPFTKEKEWRETIRRAQSGDQAARAAVVEENTGLIHMVLKRFSNQRYDMEDLFQIGAIGLIRAVDKFDLGTEYEFSTYAVPMIIGEIRRFMRDDGMIHVSRQIKENAYRIAKMKERWAKEMRREPTVEDIGQELGLNREDILMAMEASQEVDCLHRIIPSPRGGTKSSRMMLEEIIPDKRCSDRKLFERVMIGQMLEGLEPRERLLLVYRYIEGKTQSEVASALQMNQVAVSRMEKRILTELRKKYTDA